MIGLLNRTAGTSEKLEMIYLSNNNQMSQRVIRVISVSGSIVKAYCYTKKQYRIFKLDNILSIGPMRKRVGA